MNESGNEAVLPITMTSLLMKKITISFTSATFASLAFSSCDEQTESVNANKSVVSETAQQLSLLDKQKRIHGLEARAVRL